MSTTKVVSVEGELRCLVGDSIVEMPPELISKLNDLVDDYFSVPSMMPDQLDLPFFAYGLFKEGQLGFAAISKYVKHVYPAEMDGRLWERDGVPLWDGSGQGRVLGSLVWFHADYSRDGYLAVASIEPEALFEWRVQSVLSGQQANVLAARSLHGADELESVEWDGRTDPVLSRAPQLVKSLKDRACALEFGSIDRMLTLEAAYMLLLTAIERYTSLRYHLGKKVMAKVRKMAAEPGFQEALLEIVQEERIVFSTSGTGRERLSRNHPEKSLRYYYQVRSNITHRGKALARDTELLEKCIDELVPIFERTRDRGFNECRFEASPRLQSTL